MEDTDVLIIKMLPNHVANIYIKLQKKKKKRYNKNTLAIFTSGNTASVYMSII